jgi:hypothetical protein
MSPVAIAKYGDAGGIDLANAPKGLLCHPEPATARRGTLQLEWKRSGGKRARIAVVRSLAVFAAQDDKA